jgi:hypothetical protein
LYISADGNYADRKCFVLSKNIIMIKCCPCRLDNPGRIPLEITEDIT